ncbi:hypothetical protein M406DRAFT_73518 [Cryphonectria parasitica EP155]|uniref:F-box domain-containing protein n=1 Tax=Cryphonectria parasitica (strain ATCC 38755 / EP155) TaxID=660469 RepID=A0A9P5CJ70_CRYP1|nr:uncharacterized protein M406DRAFT_73518 [Cryphonectria parasitica EP155]KAF3761074.1 hypothetical protein M406DRAFT_73518 [Cryphonectria parasitica EP155]
MSLAVDDREKLAIYNLATKPCSCGSGVLRCTSRAHAEALDGLAAVCEAQKAYDKAYSYASLLVIVAPQAPEGYLRLAKALRLKDPSNGSATKSRCSWIYSQAAQSVQSYGDASDEKLKVLRNLLRKDIIRSLPIELQVMVLRKLSYKDLCTAMLVSKVWNHACRNRGLWRHLEFVKGWKSIEVRKHPGIMNEVICRRSQNLATSLLIKSMRDFGINHVKLRAILRALPHLKSLSLHGFDTRSALYRPDLYQKAPALRATIDAILNDAPATLETLNLEDFHHKERATPSQEKLVHSTPALKDLTLSDVLIQNKAVPSPRWSRLERLSIGRMKGRLFASCSEVRSLELLESGNQAVPRLFDSIRPHQGQTENPEKLHNLEHFYYSWSDDRMAPSPSDLERIKPSCDNGTLHSLHITFNKQSRNVLDKIINKDAIRTLSCYDILMPSIRDDGGGSRGDMQIFVDWVIGFRNLTTIGVFPQKTDEAWFVVAKLITERPDIKTIYTDVLHGINRDMILEHAARKGIEIIHASRVPEPALQCIMTSEPLHAAQVG